MTDDTPQLIAASVQLPSEAPATSTSSTDAALAADPTSADIRFLPILDVSRGIVAGYQLETQPVIDSLTGKPLFDDTDGRHTAELIRAALEASVDMPVNTFLTIPISVAVAGSRRVLAALLSQSRLDGVVIDLNCSVGAVPSADLAEAVERYREAGALICVGGQGSAQPCLNGLVSFKPSFVRLSRDWIRGVDTSIAKRSALEVIGRLTAQLNAWILVEGVCSAAELRSLAGLGIPLAQGPFIGAPQSGWCDVEANATRALPPTSDIETTSPLRDLMQAAYTATDPTVAVAVLGETTGFDAVVVVDEHNHPRTLLEPGTGTGWKSSEAFTVNIETSPNDAIQRAMSRPRTTRFTPLVCTDDQGRFLGLLRIERLMSYLAKD